MLTHWVLKYIRGTHNFQKYRNHFKLLGARRVKVKRKRWRAPLYRPCTAHRGSRVIALPFLDHGTRRGWVVSVTPRPLFTPGKDPVPVVQEAGWAPGPVWTGAENLAYTGIRFPDRPACSQSLYRLRYPAHPEGWRESNSKMKTHENSTARHII
jgi:hypothetical protein